MTKKIIKTLTADETRQVTGGALYSSLNRSGLMTVGGGGLSAIKTADLSDDPKCSVVSKTPFCKVTT